MNPPEQNDPLDALFREQSTYTNDDGFTARVMTALPRRRRTWLRPTILLGVTTIGWVLAVLWLPWENLPPLDPAALLTQNSQVLMPWVLVLSVAASLVWAMVTTVQWED
jgi:hypothetical protein